MSQGKAGEEQKSHGKVVAAASKSNVASKDVEKKSKDDDDTDDSDEGDTDDSDEDEGLSPEEGDDDVSSRMVKGFSPCVRLKEAVLY